uniref:Uncharacterized protein n=1 Tax=Romanomermis culicivorax TaxID=13658 RepID=A0A915I8N1_ROMCU
MEKDPHLIRSSIGYPSRPSTASMLLSFTEPSFATAASLHSTSASFIRFGLGVESPSFDDKLVADDEEVVGDSIPQPRSPFRSSTPPRADDADVARPLLATDWALLATAPIPPASIRRASAVGGEMLPRCDGS